MIKKRATISHLSKRATSKFFAFFFAHFYPRLEPGAVRDWRRGLVARASGRVHIFTFCSVRRPDAAAREIYRVLRPGGRLLFMEHVRSAHPAWARLQRAVTPAWSLCAGGCRLDRDTLDHFLEAGFTLGPVARAGGGVLPVVRGVAFKKN